MSLDTGKVSAKEASGTEPADRQAAPQASGWKRLRTSGWKHLIDPANVREHDIRGVVGSTISTDDARAIGRAFGTIVARRRGSSVVVGRDGRLSSPALEAALVEGLMACGLTVWRLGIGPAPMIYFAIEKLAADGGIVVTGSHNPPQYNGFKMVTGGSPFCGESIRQLRQVAASGTFVSGHGSAHELPLLDRYLERLLQDHRGTRDLAVAWDAGNGAAGPAMAMLAASIPGRHIVVNETVDGTFPAHHPDPTIAANLEQLIDVVRSEKCDLGLAFDGDGDRIGVVDAMGRIVWADQLLALLAGSVLTEYPNATIVADVKASQALFDGIERLGGRAIMCATGRSGIGAKMAETGALLAGEMSGHIFFADRYYGFDDALYAAVRLLELVACSEEPLHSMVDRLPRVANTPEIRFPCAEPGRQDVIEKVRALADADGASICDIDGIRVTTADGWWLLRESGTENVLVVRCEAADAAGLERVKKDLAARLAACGVDAPEGL